MEYSGWRCDIQQWGHSTIAQWGQRCIYLLVCICLCWCVFHWKFSSFHTYAFDCIGMKLNFLNIFFSVRLNQCQWNCFILMQKFLIPLDFFVFLLQEYFFRISHLKREVYSSNASHHEQEQNYSYAKLVSNMGFKGKTFSKSPKGAWIILCCRCNTPQMYCWNRKTPNFPLSIFLSKTAMYFVTHTGHRVHLCMGRARP